MTQVCNVSVKSGRSTSHYLLLFKQGFTDKPVHSARTSSISLNGVRRGTPELYTFHTHWSYRINDSQSKLNFFHRPTEQVRSTTWRYGASGLALGNSICIYLPRVPDILSIRSDMLLQECGHPDIVATILRVSLWDYACHRTGTVKLFHPAWIGCSERHHAYKLSMFCSCLPG